MNSSTSYTTGASAANENAVVVSSPLQTSSSLLPPLPPPPLAATALKHGGSSAGSSGGIANDTFRPLPPPPKLSVGGAFTFAQSAAELRSDSIGTSSSAIFGSTAGSSRSSYSHSHTAASAGEATSSSTSTSTTVAPHSVTTTTTTPAEMLAPPATISTTTATANVAINPSATSSSHHHRYYHPLLAYRQFSFPILILGTSTATKTFASNYNSLSHWFQSVADHTMTASTMPSNSPKAIPPIPLRSINRTVHLDLFHTTTNHKDVVSSSSSSSSYTRIPISVRFMDTEMMDSRHQQQQHQSQQPEHLIKAAAAASSTSMIGDTAASTHPITDLSMIQITDYLQNMHLSLSKQKQHQKLMLAGLGTQQLHQQQRQVSTEFSVPSINSADETTTTTTNPSVELIATLQKFTAVPDLPFMKQTRLVYDELTDFTTHEMFHCPLVILFIATTQEETTNQNPIQAFQELVYNTNHLPKAYLNGQFDPSDYTLGHGGAKRYMLLLHDTHAENAPPFNESTIQKQLQNAFPSADCTVLSMDRNNHTKNNKQLSSYILQMTRDGCIPALERRIVYLNAVVSNARKGVKNVFKQFWRKPKNATNASYPSAEGSAFPTSFSSLLGVSGTPFSNNMLEYSGQKSIHGGGGATTAPLGQHDNNPTGSAMPSSLDVVPYRYDSVESQARLLADSLFLIKDFDTSLSFYRLVRDDFKMDKAMVYYASIQEMIALCIYSIENNCYNTTAASFPTTTSSKYSRDTHFALDAAVYSYTRAADEEHQQQQDNTITTRSSSSTSNLPSRPQTSALATRLATRLCFILSRITPTSTLTPNQLVEIADLLASASSHETPLGAAILLEQASRHYLAASHWNKYAFHMLMSGHMYRSSRLERHAARCFTASLTIYQRFPQWKELVDHLLSALAQQLYSTEYYSLALLLYVQLMDGSTAGKINNKNLYKFWNHILEICKSKPSEAEVSVRLLYDMILSPEDHYHKSPSSLLHEITNVDIANEKCSSSDDALNLELCNLDLPRIYDNTVQVIEIPSIIHQNVGISSASSSANLMETDRCTSTLIDGGDGIETRAKFCIENEDSSSKKIGSSSIWMEMSNTMEAELRASLDIASTGSIVTEDAIFFSMQRLENDKAMERKITQKQTESVRACDEPFLVNVTFANPLDIQLHLTEIQLVASFTACINKCYITGSNLARDPATKFLPRSISSAELSSKTWTYGCLPDINFKVPSFYTESSDTSNAFNEEGVLSPLFCVEVKDLSMDASSVCAVALAICPLAKGELNIVGVRCKIFDRVWVYHHFSLRGPLLQNNRHNKANRIRGPRTTLKSIISDRMPLLHVDVKLDAAFTYNAVTGYASSMLQGEVSKGSFFLRNIGRAPAFRIFLKTNTPSICLSSESADFDRAGYEKMATSNCVGPSGTLMQLLPDRVLEPGDFVEVPFLLKAGGGGTQELYCLVSYEPYGMYSNLAAPYSFKNNCIRTMKKLLDLFVYPSLTVSASVTPSFCDKGESVLSLELTNCRSDRQEKLDMVLKNVLICSRYYRACRLEENSIRCLPTTTIGCQERIALHYRLMPCLSNNEPCIFSEFIESEDTDIAEKNNVLRHSFACLEDAYEKFSLNASTYRRRLARLAQQRDVAQIRRDKTKLPSTLSSGNLLSEINAFPSRLSYNRADAEVEGEGAIDALEGTSLLSLCCSPDPHIVNIICNWQAVNCASELNMSVFGNHHVLQVPVQYLPSQEHRSFDYFPLTISADYNPNVYHDFQKKRIATTSFKVTVSNKIPPKITESLGKPIEAKNAVEFECFFIPQRDYDLAGLKSFRATLSGGEHISIPMKAYFLSEGIYNLQCVRLTVYDGKGEGLSQTFPMHWIINVKDKNEVLFHDS